MMRRVPLLRHTPLHTLVPLPRRAGLRSVTPLHPVRRRRAATGHPVDRMTPEQWEALRALTWARCGGHCEMCAGKLNPDWWEWSHRLAEGQGGPADIRNGCALHPLSCHREGPQSVHKAPEQAWQDGFIVRTGEDFRRRPVLIGRERWALLTADGGYDWVESGEAA